MEIKDCVYERLFNGLSKNDTQNVFTPPRLIRRMLSRVDFNNNDKVLVWYNIEFLIYLVKEIRLSPKNIYIYTNTQDKLILEKQGYNVVYQENIDFDKIKNEFLDMKFDVVLGNPPYQLKVGNKKTESLWNKFVKKSFEVCSENGYVSLVHPSGWRNIDGKYKEIQVLIKNKNLIHLDINSVEEGQKMFNATTPFDWYVIQNTTNKGINTIKFESGEIKIIDISKLDLIPNDFFDKIMRLIANENEDRVEVLHSYSIYENRKSHMNKSQSDTHIYPCVYSVLSDGTINLMYSTTNQKGHFGIPKVVFGNGTNPTSFVDNQGQYGLTQFAFGIVDSAENLTLIQEAIKSDEFQKLNKATKYVATAGNPLVYPKILSLFKKDFWREFINE